MRIETGSSFELIILCFVSRSNNPPPPPPSIIKSSFIQRCYSIDKNARDSRAASVQANFTLFAKLQNTFFSFFTITREKAFKSGRTKEQRLKSQRRNISLKEGVRRRGIGCLDESFQIGKIAKRESDS